MSNRPNILFLMTDQMQGRVLDPGHPCQTPNMDRLIQMGVRFKNAYPANAVCSPSRASLMTGLLPHNHGVLTVTHTVDSDQSCLRTEHPHWAQRLEIAGYKTGYFGKWHVERSSKLEQFGWQINGTNGNELWQQRQKEILGNNPPQQTFSLQRNLDNPPGYKESIFYGVTDLPSEQRNMGVTVSLAEDFLRQASTTDDPWCCFVSLQEPHDPFISEQSAFDLYEVDGIALPPNVKDDLQGRPGIYRKAARVWQTFTDQERREAATCYYASITEIDQLFGQLIDLVEINGESENTIIVITSDHGELLGAHGLYCKNFSASEEIYNIPLVISGPGCAKGITTDARVGLHDLCPSLLDLVDCEPIDVPDSRSFASMLSDPKSEEHQFMTGFAEYYGGRMILTQRVIWNGSWKFVFNGFDFDELYNLDADPYEMTNLAEDPTYQEQLNQMTSQMWQVANDTNDHSLFNSQYPILRVASVGPLVLNAK